MSENVKRTHQIYNRKKHAWWQTPGRAMTTFRRFAWKMPERAAKDIVEGHPDLVAVPITENP